MISEKLMSYDTEIVDRAVRWLKILKPANEILPIELHLIALMHKDINTLGISNPSSTQNAPFNELIRSCLVFSRAANDTSEKNSYRHLFFNHAFFWFYPQILKADEYFLKGWDKFFSLNPDDRQRSFGDLANANNVYAQVMLNAIEIQKNMKSYIYALDRLHEISSWVAFDLINFSDKNRINSNLSSKMKLVSDSWKSIDEFTSLLQFESDYQQDAQSRQELLKRMTILNNQIMEVLKQLEDFYQLRSESIINKSYSSNVELSDLRSIHHALSIVGNDASMRKRLFDSYQQIKLQSGKSVANSNNDQSRLKNSVFSEFLQINSELTRWMYRSLLEKSENGFVNTLPSRSDQSLPAKSQPESSFVNFNSFLGLLNQHLIKLTNDNELKKEQPDFRYLWENERFIRLIPLVLAEDVKDHISRIYITKTNSHHLRLSSQRLWNMHWGPIEQTDPPYYKVLGEICLQHAENSNRELAIDTKMIQQIRKEYKESSNPEIVIQPILRVAGSSELSIPFEIIPGKNLDSLNVNATTWLDGDQVLRSTFNSFKTANLNLLAGANSLKLEDRLWETSESKNDSDISEYQTGIEVGLLFRGNHLKNRSQLIVYRQPTWSDVRPLPVAGGSIALQTEKNIIGKYGKSGGSVCFVLDCSGSMGVGSGTEWSDAAKYAQAVKSVLDTIKQLPKDTEITIWVFGESVGTERNAADSKTIRQVIKSLKWNPDDSRIYDEIKLRISYPECIPWNRSPIVESMRKAASDLVNNRGPRVMVVITDGQDTGLNDTVDTDPKQKNVKIRNNNELIADKIRAIFSTRDISVNVIGFKLAREEAQSIQDQFSVVQDLPTPGVYTSIDKEGELSALMNSVLRRKLYYRIDSEYNDKIREEAIEGVEFQTPGITDRWINPSLDAGIYKIWSDLGRRISSRFSISNGRRLLLELKEDDNGTPVFQKKKWLSSSFPFRPAVVSKDWRFTWIASKSSTDQLKILAGIENEREFQPDSIIEMIEPGDWDIKVTEKDHQTKLLSGSMRRLWNYQSPVWEINLNKYKQNIGNPAMFLEIQDSNQFNSVLNLRKKIEFQEIGEIVNKRFSYEGNQILVKSAGIQERWLQDQFNGEKLTKQKCFVIRIEHDAGRRIRPDVVFTRNIFHNKSYRYYEPAGVSETIIWCDSTQQNDINNLNVDSVSFTALNAIDSKDSSRIRMSLGDKMKIPLRGDIWPDPVLTEQVPSGLEKTSDKSDSSMTELPSALEKPK